MYALHPSLELRELFRRKPFQGAHPFEAKALFIGLDANYAADIGASPIYPKVVEYHEDGVRFWKKYRVHHPFLLPGYRGDGRFFHRSFARLGLGADDADAVSFIELLHVPTVGRSRLSPDDLDSRHLAFIDEAVTHGCCKLVFLSPSVDRLMRQSRRFAWLANGNDTAEPPPMLIHAGESVRVYRHLHFSTYGKFARLKDEQAASIASLISSKTSAVGRESLLR